MEKTSRVLREIYLNPGITNQELSKKLDITCDQANSFCNYSVSRGWVSKKKEKKKEKCMGRKSINRWEINKNQKNFIKKLIKEYRGEDVKETNDSDSQ